MTDAFPGFTKEAFRFLRDLERNNNRHWFMDHKRVYEETVKQPMTELVLALGNAMQSFAPELVVDPKRAIYRIYRDIRFSPDKTPYKTHVAAIFAPRSLPKHAGASLYFQVDPSEVLIAGGVYMPGSAELRAIRSHIADNHEDLEAIIRDRTFKRLFGGLEGERLTRPPKGFPADHPASNLLRYKQYLVYVTEPAALAGSPKLLPRLLVLFAAMMPLLRFLNAPLLAEPRIRAGIP